MATNHWQRMSVSSPETHCIIETDVSQGGVQISLGMTA